MLISSMSYYFAVTHSISLEKEKLENLNSTQIEIYDSFGERISPSSEAFISIENLSPLTKSAFICAEDKRFYSHHGVDLIRVAGAVISNLKSHSFSEGASTISQQLIKNTHLSNEKTIKRKLKEVKLTRQLEKNYSKDEILEMYLNNIYFGNGCYGIENASKHYFGKSAKNLTLNESAILAGTINAPAVYDIQKNTQKAIERKNLILSLMKSQGKISEKQLEDAKNEELKLNLTNISNENFVYNEIIKEACQILKKSENELKNLNLKIETYYDKKLSDEIKQKIKNLNTDEEINISTLVLDNKTGGILCAIGCNGLSSNHQPGSTIKPILVYGPAIEKGIVSPATKILDEKINISGYSPENADKTYHGYVSVREALKNSYNIPAVKLLNEVGIENAQNLASKMGITFSALDKNLAIALGGFTDGISLSSLADSYMALSNYGNYKKSAFISKIYRNNAQIYQDNRKFSKTLSESTAYILTDILKSSSKSGTAKKLKDLKFSVASKTGTVGLSNSSKNTDAYNVSYTKNHTVLTYFGGKQMSEKINGATYPTLLSKDIYNLLYKEKTPPEFYIPSEVKTLKISKSDYENNIVSLASNSSDSFTEIFSKSNMPSRKKIDFSPQIEVFNFENKKPIISFCIANSISYKIIRKDELNEEIVSSGSGTTDNQIIKFEDKTAKSNGIYEYFVEFCEKNSNKTYKSKSIKLRSF